MLIFSVTNKPRFCIHRKCGCKSGGIGGKKQAVFCMRMMPISSKIHLKVRVRKKSTAL